MTKEEKLNLLNRVFTPSAPIKERDFFIGRKRQLEKVRDAINTIGQHVVLYGERGVGKTSLANIMSHIYTNLYPVKITCERNATFQSLWSRVFSEIQYSQTVQGIGFNAEKRTELVDIAALYHNNTCGNEIANVIEVLKKLPLHKFLFIFDEFDRVNNEQVRILFAQLIKILSDNCSNVTIVLVGIGENVCELLEEHLSVERCLKQVKMPKMHDDECLDIITSGLKKIELNISTAVANRIVNFSSGFPHYVHLICNLGAMELILNDKLDFTQEYLTIAIRKAIENSGESLRLAYQKAVGSIEVSKNWGQIVNACATALHDDNDAFSIKQIENAYKELRYEQVNIPYYISRLCKEEHGILLKKIGTGKNARYKFVNPMMKVFIKLKMNQR